MYHLYLHNNKFFLDFLFNLIAILATPVFAPLADNVSCSRTVVVNAYLFGQNFIGLIAPTGLILIVLQLTGVKYNQWLKFMFPFMIVMFI